MFQRKANPMSRKEITLIAEEMRYILCNPGELYTPIVDIIENRVSERLDPLFDYEIIEKESFPEGVYAITNYDKHKMYIRSDVYDDATNDVPMHRFTLSHELGHYCLQHSLSKNIGYARSKIKRYEDPEWQADAFGGAFLVPRKEVEGLGVEEIIDLYGVSYSCAKTQLSAYLRM